MRRADVARGIVERAGTITTAHVMAACGCTETQARATISALCRSGELAPTRHHEGLRTVYRPSLETERARRLESQREGVRRYRDERKKRSTCHRCSAPAVDGRRSCEAHLRRTVTRELTRQDARRAHGLCISCPNESKRFWRCAECRANIAQKRRKAAA